MTMYRSVPIPSKPPRLFNAKWVLRGVAAWLAGFVLMNLLGVLRELVAADFLLAAGALALWIGIASGCVMIGYGRWYGSHKWRAWHFAVARMRAAEQAEFYAHADRYTAGH